jgi:hypothetical protein
VHHRDGVIGPKLGPQRPDKAFVDLDSDNVTSGLGQSSGQRT